MTTTNKPQLKRVDRPIDALGPIEALKVQQGKLEEALKCAEDRVNYKKETLADAEKRKHEIEDDLRLTELILSQYGINKPYAQVDIVVKNAMPIHSVANSQYARDAFSRRSPAK